LPVALSEGLDVLLAVRRWRRVLDRESA
jgi:hypothetical protein